MITLPDCVTQMHLQHLLQERLAHRESLAFFRIDLVNFRTYLEEYGCERGDAVLSMLGQVICASSAAVGTPGDCVAYLGWDEFLLLTQPECAEALAKEIIARFDVQIPEYYSAEARQQGFVDRVDRRGNPFRAPLMGVAIAIVSNEKRDLTHPLQVFQLVSEVRSYLRFAPSSRYAFDRRQK